MKAVILAAGVGRRLGGSAGQKPKCLLEFGGRSLLRRHFDLLARCGVRDVAVGVGYRAQEVGAEIARWNSGLQVEIVQNPDFEQGSMVTLWHLRKAVAAARDLLLMDADVLYDRRMLERLIASPHANCFLLDRDFVPGDEPVKLCVRDGRLVEFRKKVAVEFDYCGESVGFFRFSPGMAATLNAAVQHYVDAGRVAEPHEEAIRDVLLAEPEAFGWEDVTGIPWLEIDFPEDVARARDEILPALRGEPDA